MNNETILNELKAVPFFDRKILYEVINKQGSEYSKNSLTWLLGKFIAEGNVERIGRNKYRVILHSEKAKKVYEPMESERLKEVRNFVLKKYPLVDFCIWETVQINEFLNHQIANNAIVIEVENRIENMVYTTLKEVFGRNVLLKPDEKERIYYQENETIIVMKLISEAPVNRRERHTNTIEKLLVDLESNEFLNSSFALSELNQIDQEIFLKYVVDQNRLYRYARRRNAVQRIEKRMEITNKHQQQFL